MTARPSDKFIPWYIVAFFVAQTCLYIWFLQLAHDSYPGVVTDKAYDKGLKYNDTILKAERQAQLGWTSVLSAQRLDSGAAHVELTLKDASGKPVSGAAVSLWFFRPVKDGMDQHTGMQPEAGGRYTADATLPARGLWEVRAEAVAGDIRYQISKKVTF